MNLERPKSNTTWFYLADLAGILYEARRSETGLSSLEDKRRKIKGILKDAHEYLISRTSDRNAYFVIFAMVALADENMQEHNQKHASETWHPLQTELFDITDAGTLFYQYMDYFRGRNDIPVVIYEMFYFCLNDGFKGSKIAEPEVRNAYMEELKVHIPTEKIPTRLGTPVITEKAKRRIPAAFYYVVAFLMALMVRLLLELIPLEIPS